ncbi:LOW QUALITY PROTEIN: olfactory receptor-like protein COR6 [Meleagris gallopavo]|uniref:LOW QUALITY PROTEIN: olfactory receptor-like protein COR6 n=1 Tax=Meleagris gallopavo TaxID=9103 RepID=UPI00093DBE11|nr:LOW QUALITY PROTEIN: olfactory receptor-like protein COR6 [Meleagris gallopavo]
MASENCTAPTTFILSGLTDNPRLQMPLLVVFLAIYITTLMTNLGLTALISIDIQLQTPMYIFLQNLSFTDAAYSTVITPKMLATFLEETKTISYGGCILQYFSFVLLSISECLLLAVMAYDRYVAICKPLLYTVIMTKAVWLRLVKGLYFLAFLNSLMHTSGLLKLSFCSSNVLNHFFCDISPLFLISSSSTALNELLVFIFGSLFMVINIISTLISYIFIILTVLRIRSDDGGKKIFHTCASHLTVITIFFGALTFSYIQPSSSYSVEQEKISAVFYTLLVPMLNPLIYSLRNRKVRSSFRRTFRVRELFH